MKNDNLKTESAVRWQLEWAFKRGDVGAAEAALGAAVALGDDDLITTCRTTVGKLYLLNDLIDLPDEKKVVHYERQFKRLCDHVSMIAFDLRNPLSAMLLNISIIEKHGRDWPSDKREKYLGRIAQFLDQMVEITDMMTPREISSWLDDERSGSE